ncbi:hypothetical protein HYW75_00105 [Candidatus Pacearchaeota archaeon]|nr:hypothetical protein [Candidatus Pacearchaeota archaeon]
MKKSIAKSLDEIKFVSFKELLLPDNDKIRKLKSIYGMEVEYLDFLGPLEFFIANYGITNTKLKDKDVVLALRRLRDNLDKEISFFRDELEYNLIMTLNVSLQIQRKITKHELMLVIKYILWAINNRNWIGDSRAYINWIANFFHLLDGDNKKKFDQLYENLGKEYSFSKDKIKTLKGENLDYEPPPSEIILDKMGSENFDENKNEFWSPGAYAQTVSPADEDFEEKMKYFAGDIDEKKENNCKKCKTPIGKHNLHWHEGMCDDCFFKEYKM